MLVYNYINNNKSEFYEFCIEENNELIVQIEINRIIKRYPFNEYINLIKEDGFYGDYIELYSINKIFKKPIIILKSNDININDEFYELVRVYNNLNRDNTASIYNIEDIMFLNYENNIH